MVTIRPGAPVVRMKDYFEALCPNDDIAFFVNATSIDDAGSFDTLQADSIRISNYKLSASVVCSKLCHAAEEAWGIL